MRNIFTGAVLALVVFTAAQAREQGDWPMRNDPGFVPTLADPAYEAGQGPVVLLDGAHHNFFVQWDLIDPFAKLAEADGYRTVKGEQLFTPDYLAGFDIVMIITALPFDFTTKTEVTTESTFTADEIEALHAWVSGGGSLLVFSEHAPFDQAINPLLAPFGITSSVGTVGDPENFDADLGNDGWVVFTRENGLLNTEHPITQGRDASEAIDGLIAFGGSSLSGEGYTNLMQLSPTAENRRHPTGVGPEGMGNSQGLAGEVGKGKVVAFGDSNGFTAMVFTGDDGSEMALGMNAPPNYDWPQMVLNVLRWLSGALDAE